MRTGTISGKTKIIVGCFISIFVLLTSCKSDNVTSNTNSENTSPIISKESSITSANSSSLSSSYNNESSSLDTESSDEEDSSTSVSNSSKTESNNNSYNVELPWL